MKNTLGIFFVLAMAMLIDASAQGETETSHEAEYTGHPTELPILPVKQEEIIAHGNALAYILGNPGRCVDEENQKTFDALADTDNWRGFLEGLKTESPGQAWRLLLRALGGSGEEGQKKGKSLIMRLGKLTLEKRKEVLNTLGIPHQLHGLIHHYASKFRGVSVANVANEVKENVQERHRNRKARKTLRQMNAE